MTIEENIAIAKVEVDKLKQLLDDPYPGIAHWQIAVANQAKKVSNHFGYYGDKDGKVES